MGNTTLAAPLSHLQLLIARSIRAKVAGPDATEREKQIWGAPGERWFRPEDPISLVHADASMYVGGIRALLLQALHPLAMAGVAGHSGFKGDPWGRLQRTSEYIAVTTFGRIDDAERVIARIRGIHRGVNGTAPDGRPYAASDPHLLKWVHIAEIESFLTAYQTFNPHPLSPADADRYVAQTSEIGRRVGVVDPPVTVAELYDHLRSYGPELEATDAAMDTVQFLLFEPPLPPSAKAGYWLLAQAAVSILPASARRMLDLGDWRVTDAFLGRPAGDVSTALVRWAFGHPDMHKPTPGWRAETSETAEPGEKWASS